MLPGPVLGCCDRLARGMFGSMLWMFELVAAACATPDPDPERVVWPPDDDSMAPDDWIMVALNSSEVDELVVTSSTGEIVPVQYIEFGQGPVHAVVPASPLLVGATYYVSIPNQPDTALRVTSWADSFHATPPIPVRRMVHIDASVELCAGLETLTDVYYAYCSAAPITVVAESEDAPPTDARAASVLLAVAKGTSIHLYPAPVSIEPPAIDFDPGSTHTLWLGALGSDGQIAWTGPDMVVMPPSGDDTTVYGVGGRENECPPEFQGWLPPDSCNDCSSDPPRDGSACSFAPFRLGDSGWGLIAVALTVRARQGRGRRSTFNASLLKAGSISSLGCKRNRYTV